MRGFAISPDGRTLVYGAAEGGVRRIYRRSMDAAGIHVVDTPVGDRYVLEALDRGGYSLGGEQSGHLIFRELASTGDGVLSAAQLLDVAARSGRSLSDLAADALRVLNLNYPDHPGVAEVRNL